jgi:hypothetical protein
VTRTGHLVVLAVVAITATSLIACGDDDDESTTGADGAAGQAAAPPPERAFRGLSAALEAQGLDVEQLPKTSLNGAEVGVDISGDKSGAARSFATEAEAQEYADEVAKDGDKTTIVGTVVIQAPTQADADFFADAYEGG